MMVPGTRWFPPGLQTGCFVWSPSALSQAGDLQHRSRCWSWLRDGGSKMCGFGKRCEIRANQTGKYELSRKCRKAINLYEVVMFLDLKASQCHDCMMMNVIAIVDRLVLFQMAAFTTLLIMWAHCPDIPCCERGHRCCFMLTSYCAAMLYPVRNQDVACLGWGLVRNTNRTSP